MEKYGRAVQVTDDRIILNMCIGCWIPKAKNTHSEFVILTAFSLLQWLHEGASVLRLYVQCVYSDTSANEDNSFRNNIL